MSEVIKGHSIRISQDLLLRAKEKMRRGRTGVRGFSHLVTLLLEQYVARDDNFCMVYGEEPLPGQDRAPISRLYKRKAAVLEDVPADRPVSAVPERAEKVEYDESNPSPEVRALVEPINSYNVIRCGSPLTAASFIAVISLEDLRALDRSEFVINGMAHPSYLLDDDFSPSPLVFLDLTHPFTKFLQLRCPDVLRDPCCEDFARWYAPRHEQTAPLLLVHNSPDCLKDLLVTWYNEGWLDELPRGDQARVLSTRS